MQTLYAVHAHCVHTIYGGADQTASSDLWVMPAVGGGFLAIVALSAWLYKHDGPDDSGGDGGSGGPPPEPPPPPPDGPTWWPEFEREFAAYVAGKDENEKCPFPVGPGGSARPALLQSRCLPLAPGVSRWESRSRALPL
jgi:hypothetical protein